MSAIGIGQDGLEAPPAPAAAPSSFDVRGLVVPLVVVGAIFTAGIALCIYKKREGIRRALHLQKAADEATSPIKDLPPIKLDLPKARDLRYKREDKKKADLEKQATINKSTLTDSEKKDERKPPKPVRKETSRLEKLALLEEGLFGKRHEDPPSAKEALREVANIASAVASPSTLPKASPPSSPLKAPAVDRSGSPEPAPLPTAPLPIPSVQTEESTTPLGSPVAIGGLPRIMIRKATTQNPENLALPDSPDRHSPPCPVSAGMRNPPLPPMPGAFDDE